jgi:hypothetical protein
MLLYKCEAIGPEYTKPACGVTPATDSAFLFELTSGIAPAPYGLENASRIESSRAILSGE